MSALTAEETGWKTGVYWFFVSALPVVRTLVGNKDRIHALIETVSEISCHEPMHLTEKHYLLAPFPGKEFTGAGIVGVMLACLWVMCAEDASLCGALLFTWSDLPSYALLAGGKPL